MWNMIASVVEAILRTTRKPEPTPYPKKVPLTFADRVHAAMRKLDYTVDEWNIVYVRGCGVDGKPNGNPGNDRFNDVRMILRVNKAFGPQIVKAWPCTVDPGHYYVSHRINTGGAAQIEPGQYRAWQVGMHRGDHEALVQTGGPVTVRRDDNEDFTNAGDPLDTGYFGINAHGPGTALGDRVAETVGRYSAGCLVVPSMKMQREFMDAVKQFPGYRANRKFIFTQTILTDKDL